MVAYPAVGSTFGPYEITGVLGHGAMGVVLSAVHVKLGRKVAVKVLSADLASRAEFRRRFEREADALARLYSPHVIDVYECGEVDGWLYIATQLVVGRDLRDVLAQDGPLTPAEALGVAAQVAGALSDAHDAGIIHRDIKPSNVLMRRSTDELFVYVCDFGISQSEDGERTRTGGVLGTYAYMAPERHEGTEATAASDIYSLGCVLHAALTGRPPYEGTDVQVAMQHLHGDVPEHTGDARTAAAVNGIYRRSLAKEPAARYPTAHAMRLDLVAAQRALEDLPASGPGVERTVATVAHAPRTPTTEAPPRTEPPRRGRGRRAALAVLVVGALAAAAAFLVPRLIPDGPLQCWDDQRVDRPQECTAPAGPDGLRWMFPSLDRDFGSCYRQTGDSREINSDAREDASLWTWFCPVGSKVEGVGYTEWASLPEAKAHFNQVFGHRPTTFELDGTTAGYHWVLPQPNRKGFYKSAWLHRDHPFSATVWAKDEADVSRYCLSITMRSMPTFRTEPMVCDAA